MSDVNGSPILFYFYLFFFKFSVHYHYIIIIIIITIVSIYIGTIYKFTFKLSKRSIFFVSFDPQFKSCVNKIYMEKKKRKWNYERKLY